MDVVDTGYTFHKRKNVRQQVNTENKKTAAARPEGGGGGGFFEGDPYVTYGVPKCVCDDYRIYQPKHNPPALRGVQLRFFTVCC